MNIFQPDNLQAALAAVQDGAIPVAGGTGLQLQWAQGISKPESMVDINALLPSEIDRHVIGAGAKLEMIRQADIPLLSEAARDVAAPNVRRMATLGGTIGFGAGCLIPALLALDARLETTVGMADLADYLVAPQGLILSVRINPLKSNCTRHFWRKVGLRSAFSPSIIVVAGTYTIEDEQIICPRLAIGGGVVTPHRLPNVESWLAGKALSDVNRDVLYEMLMDNMLAPDCDFRTGEYRRQAASNAVIDGILGSAPSKPISPLPRPEPTQMPNMTVLSREMGGNRWHTRPDLPNKVRGQTPYLTDHRETDMLVGRILRSQHAHAQILSIDISAAEALPGVQAVVTHKDIKGVNSFGIVFPDQPALCADKVRYIGDPIAAVAAETAEIAEAALALIKVEYCVLPTVTEPLSALCDSAPLIHANGNLINEITLSRGNVDQGFADAVHIVEQTYETPRQMHAFMETEGGWIKPHEGGLKICVGGQHGARDRMQLARILAMPEDRLQIVTSPIGGGFGGKDELTVQPALALLALKSGRPVRLQLSRSESVRAGTKRHPMTIKMRTGIDADGKLVAQEVDLVTDGGAYASLGPAVMETAMEHCAGPYLVDNISTRGRTIYTNNGACGAFRGFGANQMSYAIECQMDQLAAKAGIDPITIRKINMRRKGMPGYLGQKVAPTERLNEMLQAAQASKLWQAFNVGEDEIAGVGMATVLQGTGLGTLPEDEASFSLGLKDGKIEARCGLDEMGQGLIASFHAMIEQTMGCSRSDVRVIFGDTSQTPDSGSTSAARGGYVAWRSVSETAPKLSACILQKASEKLGIKSDDLIIVPNGVGQVGTNAQRPLINFADLGEISAQTTYFEFPKSNYTKGNARFIFAFGTALARVAVNKVTGLVRVMDLEYHTAAGPVIDMASYLGQMEGAVGQGIGFSLTEDALMRDGQFITNNFDSYMLPTVRDAPVNITVTADETLDRDDPYGPRGAGELGMSGATPAIANAIADALGQWPIKTPFQPEMILQMIKEAGL